MTLDAQPARLVRNTPTGPIYRDLDAAVRSKGRMPRQKLPPTVINERFPRKFLNTVGTIAPDGEAYVYAAAVSANRIKIGMTARRPQRIRNLKARELFVMPVVHSAAKEIETHTLRLLGHGPKDGEYVRGITASDAIKAIREAYRLVGGWRHVDPTITAQQARAKRIEEMASGQIPAPRA